MDKDDSMVVGLFNTNTDTELLQRLSGLEEWEVRDESEIPDESAHEPNSNVANSQLQKA